MTGEAHMSEEKAQKAMIDAARLADELRSEQECAMGLERDRKLLEAQVKDLQARLDDAEQNALKGGKKAMAKMETRVRELESEMDAENRRCADAQKNLRRSERHIKELTYQQDEDRKNHERMQGLIDQLQGKIKSYKKQIEEAEEIAALNLAKFRQVQANLTGSTERAGPGQDPCTCPQLLHWTHVNNDLWNRPQLIQGQTLKLALRNIVVYLPIYRLSVFTNVTLSKGILPSIVLSNQRINLSLQKK